jgi:hypothetical protein
MPLAARYPKADPMDSLKRKRKVGEERKKRVSGERESWIGGKDENNREITSKYPRKIR